MAYSTQENEKTADSRHSAPRGKTDMENTYTPIRVLLRAMSLLAVLALCAPVHAAIVNYPGTLTGDTVEYFNISEDSGTDPSPLFEQRPGGPTITGDTLVFQPTANFSAYAPQGAQNADTTDGLLTFTIRALEGYWIDLVTLFEGGAYSLLAVNGASAAAQATGIMYNFDDPTQSANISAQATTTANPSPFFIVAPANDVASESDGWVGTATLDFTGMEITEVTIRLDNTLQAAASDGGTAFIDKKHFSITTTTSLIPEPGSLVLMGMGAAMLLVRNRRRHDA